MSSLKCPDNLTLISDDMAIGDVVRDIIRQGPHEEPLHVLDLDDVVRKHKSWREQMPRVNSFYAVKCNDDPRILQTLITLGLGFDCASKGELERILDFGVEPERIIFAQPAKSIPSLLYARSKKVSVMTFDSAIELEKIHQYYPEAQLVLRMRHDSLKVIRVLGKKFGCDPVNEAPALLRKAARLRMNVVGISFHVGSDCEEHEVYYDAVKMARNLFDYAKSIGYELNLLDIGGGFPGDLGISFHVGSDCEEHEVYYDAVKVSRDLFDFAKSIGYEMSLLDIGGGFPGDHNKPIDRYAQAINRAIDHFFPAEENVRIIAEPGRYYVASAVTLVSFVHSKRFVTEHLEDGTERARIFYYLNDGVYGTFFSAAFEGQVPVPIVQRKADAKEYSSSVWGPSCNILDLILPDIVLPELDIGDSVVFENVGAYSSVRACQFNGFPLPKIMAYLREGTWLVAAVLTT
ncbi:AGAP011806-PA-like protein [Anopheles sinensis]|uniref:ornithine decarboxylase n=1 Tax=Anopheles sinensis TaxID=74873 RepID=A0A084WHS2_ANOSI|nr:AGAP011806-PA-like protein [Anopheles sinensis]